MWRSRGPAGGGHQGALFSVSPPPGAVGAAVAAHRPSRAGSLSQRVVTAPGPLCKCRAPVLTPRPEQGPLQPLPDAGPRPRAGRQARGRPAGLRVVKPFGGLQTPRPGGGVAKPTLGAKAARHGEGRGPQITPVRHSWCRGQTSHEGAAQTAATGPSATGPLRSSWAETGHVGGAVRSADSRGRRRPPPLTVRPARAHPQNQSDCPLGCMSSRWTCGWSVPAAQMPWGHLV